MFYTYSMTTELQIINKLIHNFDEGFTLLFNHYYKSLVIYANSLISDMNQSEDVVQEVLYKFIRHKSYLTISEDILQRYLYRSVKNSCINIIHARKKSVPIGELAQSVEDFPEYEELYSDSVISEIRRQIELLPPKTRRIVEDIAVKQEKYKETAEKYDVSVNTIKTLLKVGLKQIRTEISKKSFLFF